MNEKDLRQKDSEKAGATKLASGRRRRRPTRSIGFPRLSGDAMDVLPLLGVAILVIIVILVSLYLTGIIP